MKYLEKVRLAEEGAKYISDNISLSDYRDKLRNTGYYEYDIDNIISSIKIVLYEKYGKDFETLLLEGTLDENRGGYFELEDSVFEMIASRAKGNIIKNSKRKIKDLLYKSVRPEIIVKEVENRIFTENDIINFINEYVQENEIVSKKQEAEKIMLGFVLIVGGIILTLSMSRLFYGMIAVGIVKLRKGMSY